MPIMEISVVPIGTKSPSVGTYISQSIGVLKREKNIKYMLTPMGTVVEATSVKRLLAIALRMHRLLFSHSVKRVVTTIKIDERTDKALSMEGKLRTVSDAIKMLRKNKKTKR